jgi:hypothetical protein
MTDTNCMEIIMGSGYHGGDSDVWWIAAGGALSNILIVEVVFGSVAAVVVVGDVHVGGLGIIRKASSHLRLRLWMFGALGPML